MKRLLFVCAILVVGSFFVVAEDAPKFDVYGGWSYMHASVDNADVEEALGDDAYGTYKGFGVSGCGYITPNFGIVGDFSYHSKGFEGDNSIKNYFLMAGPQFVMRSHDAVAPFVRGLFGLAHVKAEGTVLLGTNNAKWELSENKFAFGFGGGIDVKVSDKVSVRVAQFDYIRVLGDPIKSNVFRFGAGIVFNAR